MNENKYTSGWVGIVGGGSFENTAGSA
jgi:hypothetical protein